MFIGLENDLKLVWDGLVERVGSREERKRKKKTKRAIIATRMR